MMSHVSTVLIHPHGSSAIILPFHVYTLAALACLHAPIHTIRYQSQLNAPRLPVYARTSVHEAPSPFSNPRLEPKPISGYLLYCKMGCKDMVSAIDALGIDALEELCIRRAMLPLFCCIEVVDEPRYPHTELSALAAALHYDKRLIP